jgi:thiamine pyrophosphate-dependent acetolactate synthase large subunit-like protein
VFGATLNRYTTYGGTMFPNARVVQVDNDRDALGRFVPVEQELAIHADVKLTVEALVAELERRGHSAGGYRSPTIPAAVAGFDRNSGVRDQSLPDRIDPRTLMIELDRMLPADRMLALDNGHNFTFAIDHLRVRGPRNIVQLNDAGSIGLGIGTGIGAAVGRPGTTIVVPVGDAGFLMALGDLETAVRYKLPIVVVISNDEALGVELHFLNLIGMPTKLAEFSTPSLAAVAEAIGAEAFTVRSADDLAAVEERLRRPLSGPLVLDCRINRAIRAEWLEFAMGLKTVQPV